MEENTLELALIFLLAGIITVPLFKRLGLGAILAYLAAGVALGPDGIGIVRDPDHVLKIAEIGVVMLLFVIGLELSPARLRVMRKPIFITGGMQVALSTLLLGVIVYAYGLHWKSSLVVGMALALSSTAVGLQLLSERHEMTTDHGRYAFSILLFQDLVAIPLLAAIPLLGGAKEQTLTWTMAFKAIGAIALLVILGRILLRKVFLMVATTRTPEVFTATALFTVLGAAWFLQQVGLSAGLGAFIAGVLLADSEFRHELESQIEPFQSLLLGLFFIAVGMGINVKLIIEQPLLIAAGVAVLLLIKFAVLFVIGKLPPARLPTRSAVILGSVLWLGGEFAFVVFNEARRVRLLDQESHEVLNAIVGTSMAFTPLLLLLVNYLLGRALFKQKSAEKPKYDQIEDKQAKVLIAGMGRFGQIVARLLLSQRIPFVALEDDLQTVEQLRRIGNEVFYGDSTRPDMLRAAGGEEIKIFLITMDNPETIIKTTRLIRRMYPNAKILARARDRVHAWKLMDLGAIVFRELFGSSLNMGEELLTSLGMSKEEAARRTRRFKEHDVDVLRAQHLVYDDEDALFKQTVDGRNQLGQLFAADLGKNDLSTMDDSPGDRDTDT